RRHGRSSVHRLASHGGTRITGSPRLRLRLARRPRDVLRLARPSQARLARRDPSPATCSGSHDHHRLASHGGTPAPRRAPARTTIEQEYWCTVGSSVSRGWKAATRTLPCRATTGPSP